MVSLFGVHFKSGFTDFQYMFKNVFLLQFSEIGIKNCVHEDYYRALCEQFNISYRFGLEKMGACFFYVELIISFNVSPILL